MSEAIHEVENIRFGVYSSSDIKAMSVCKIDQVKKEGYGSVYDSRMGPMLGSRTICESCGKLPHECHGHFGHIELNIPIIHPLFIKNILSYLKCICIECNKVLICQEQIDLYGWKHLQGERRFNKILTKLENIDICFQCKMPQPRFIFTSTDNIISKVHSNRKTKMSVAMTVDEIYTILNKISDDDVRLLGFDPKYVHPSNFIIEVLPVLPPCARPFVIMDGTICDDDLTIQTLEIIKSNNYLIVPNRLESRKQLDYQ